MKAHLVGGLAIFFSLMGVAQAQNVDCDPMHAAGLYDAVMASSDWAALHRTFQHGGKCVSPSVVEPWQAFTDKVGDLMANHWGEAGKFGRLAQRYPDFKTFVFGHLRQESLGHEQAFRILDNAKNSCPKGAAALCTEVRKAVQSNLSGS